MKFSPDIYQPQEYTTSALYFLFKNGLLIIEEKEGRFRIPSQLPPTLALQSIDLLYFGLIDGKACFAALCDTENTEDFNQVNLLNLFGTIEDDLFMAGCYAFHFINWHHNSKFCGRCGSPMQFLPTERGKKCSKCDHLFYPSISPCIAVAIVKDKKSILLGKISRPGLNLFSILAGFVEMGETLEECVIREVHEEVGIEIQNIKYFGSQPWALSQSLMVAFTAEYKSGRITVDGKEIPEADWYQSDSLPSNLPRSGTISRKLIDWFINSPSEKY